MQRFDILLARHGEPDCAGQSCLNRSAFVDWLARHAAAGVSRLPPPTAPRRLAAGTLQTFLASDLPRAKDSAAMLAGLLPVRTDAVFNEADIAIAPLGFSLPSALWAAIGRLLWLAGATRHESLSDAKGRAAQAAAMLLAEAESGRVLLVGHGWMNRMIGRVLVQQGMRRVQTTGQGYWSLTRFRQSDA